MEYSDLVNGACITGRYNDNYVSGRVLRIRGNAYLCNNDYASESQTPTTKEQRFWYRFILAMWGEVGTISGKFSKLKIKELNEIAYKKGDILKQERAVFTPVNYKIIGRCGDVHFLLQEGTGAILVETRKQLDDKNFELVTA